MKLNFAVFGQKVSASKPVVNCVRPTQCAVKTPRILQQVSDIGRRFMRALNRRPPSASVRGPIPRATQSRAQIESSTDLSEALLPKPAPQRYDHWQIKMPADPRQPECNEFPFAVNYDFATTQVMSATANRLQDPAFQMAFRDAIRSRQGVFEWVRGGQHGLRAELSAHISGDQAVSLGQGVFVHDLDRVNDLKGVALWTLLVSAPAMDRPGEVDTFQVPFTELNVPANQLQELSPWLERSELAWHTHLFNVDASYQDSVDNPLMLTAGCERLGKMHALNVEVSSRIQNGLVNNRAMLRETLQQLRSEFLGADPSLNSLAVDRRLNQNFPGSGNESVYPVRSVFTAKRHLPGEECPGVSIPAFVNTPSITQISEQTAYQLPVQPPLANVRELTLVGKAPLCQPTSDSAYRQMQQANHCGLASVNAFFQAEVMNSVQATNTILDQHEAVWCGPPTTLQDLRLPGLYHPNIIDGLRSGREVTISKEEFLNGKDLANHLDYQAIFAENPAEQWGALLNYDPRVAHMSHDEYRNFRDNTQEISISPDLWLSAATGIHADSLEAIVNRFLETKNGHEAWSHYPERVERISLTSSRNYNQLDKIEDKILQKIDSRSDQHNLSFPMICMVHGHYFAVARDESGNWLKLDSNGTHTNGLQRAELFARSGELDNALRDSDAIHLICEPL